MVVGCVVGFKVIGLVEVFKEYGVDFVVVDNLDDFVVKMNVIVGSDLLDMVKIRV